LARAGGSPTSSARAASHDGSRHRPGHAWHASAVGQRARAAPTSGCQAEEEQRHVEHVRPLPYSRARPVGAGVVGLVRRTQPELAGAGPDRPGRAGRRSGRLAWPLEHHPRPGPAPPGSAASARRGLPVSHTSSIVMPRPGACQQARAYRRPASPGPVNSLGTQRKKGSHLMTRPNTTRLSSRLRLLYGLALLLGLCIMLGGLARPAHAQSTLSVSDCSSDAQLQADVAQANSDNAGDVITFACSGDLKLTSTLSISGRMTLSGSGQRVTLDGGGSLQVLSVNSGSILANTSGNCFSAGGTYIDNGYNLSSGGCITSATSLQANPKLGPLASNGGPTQTMALLKGSPAIDYISLALCPKTDQRGHKR